MGSNSPKGVMREIRRKSVALQSLLRGRPFTHNRLRKIVEIDDEIVHLELALIQGKFGHCPTLFRTWVESDFRRDLCDTVQPTKITDHPDVATMERLNRHRLHHLGRILDPEVDAQAASG